MFTHVERAGGTSTHQFLERHLPGYRVMTPRALFANEPESIIRAAEYELLDRLPGPLRVGGHSVRAWPFLWPENPISMVVLRDPIERTLSHYRHQKKRLGIPWTLAAFLSDIRHHDWQTVRLAGTRDLGEAKRRLRAMDIVGFTESFSDLTSVVAGLARCECAIAHLNSGLQDEGFRGLTRQERELLNAANRLDQELYSFARGSFPAGRFSSAASELDWKHRSNVVVGSRSRLRVPRLLLESVSRRVAERGPFGEDLSRLIVARSKDFVRPGYPVHPENLEATDG